MSGPYSHDRTSAVGCQAHQNPHLQWIIQTGRSDGTRETESFLSRGRVHGRDDWRRFRAKRPSVLLAIRAPRCRSDVDAVRWFPDISVQSVQTSRVSSFFICKIWPSFAQWTLPQAVPKQNRWLVGPVQRCPCFRKRLKQMRDFFPSQR
jgi:hypothetical protein